jgi:cyclopropane fatty-acyl-phospholipid synthase-like methyltransferase
MKERDHQVTTADAIPSKPRPATADARPLRPRIIVLPDLTEDALRTAGIARGMRVLDLECGVAGFAFTIAKVIGPSGLIVGVDRSQTIIDDAGRHATVAGCCYWARFIAADPATFVPDEPFDAVVGRPTSFHPGKGAAFLRLSACVHPDGLIIIAPAGG